jgi:hypothetical protein
MIAMCTLVAGSSWAVINAIFIVTFSILKFTNLWINCYCGGSVLQKGQNTWVPGAMTGAQMKQVAGKYWIIGTAVSLISSFLALITLVMLKGDILYTGKKVFRTDDSLADYSEPEDELD